MSSPKFQARRATLEDLPRLKTLWATMQFTAVDLERQLTDFQVAVNEAGVVVGAIGFQMSQRHACLHSEAFEDFGLADYARPVLWNRIQNLASNHGLVRIWTREHSPFWSHNGFQPAAAEALERLPAMWERSHPDWLTMKLKDEESLASLDKEFALFVEAEKQQRSQLLGQAKTLKTVLIVGIVVISLLFLGAAVWVLLKQRQSGVSLPAL
jgi:N-acetylglutamate synthase-like GNAT family acetyltransferase